MRELVYLSEQKLEYMFTGSGRGNSMPSIGATVGVPGVTVTMATASPTAASDSTADMARKLDEVIRFLGRDHRPVDFSTPGVRAGQWVLFDLPMGWGTGPEATGTTSGGIALFVGTASNGAEGSDSVTDLLLCGTAGHLRHRAQAASRPGSDTDSVYQYLADLEASASVENGPEGDSRADRAPSGRDLDEDVVRNAFDVMSERRPSSQRGRLRGHARVLLIADREGRSPRLVVATPLYVENPPPRLPARWFRPWRRRDVRTGA
ncbi:SAVMC3_10250 family protein [Streptomyces sp. NPDC087538]|uniref:SAVMC3_10250 family protein n=1 Tax=Streptomyces sp. NPDC087538 TaxID=3365797 RepID=UPI0038222CEC